ncbi:MAG: hypothetical protein A2268_01245 [Candidatus Raymondbacteria bacterium RifOxyA12_full_50_37]|nr:MAG: hypothetical protein A2268_01245 [Candidatus Raymondbacteria bacterium RifOxyA12_full_50_37]OGJ86428.1 MAG: hypothetical protein A2248_14210 [Candidatus Raymondbacteria bacterium RIFOXYA2_FULL_49_16]OGJ90476.1 MAG: hypothetical protein A2350_19290 [Candidatus Raymondbacteria bacterium RifOxyB12_full_50_8]OGJ95598.1 MAG: hypothetical protein A2453_12985 [Candidatus Raymondbacteria bacterium RIFOXYC2_FULL_50_21]OGP40009.1 MAG: hypothetical protein A2324_11255 [Candidatus Raymondbacteria b
MCLAVPAKIVSIDGEKAIIDTEGIRREVVVSLIPDPKVGDHVIVHAGFAIQKWSEADVAEFNGLMDEMRSVEPGAPGHGPHE